MSSPLRVVHLLSADLWAGAEVATFHLLRALAARDDVAVHAVLLNDGELARRLVAAGVSVELEPERGRRFPALVAALRPRLADADLVHAHRYKEDLLAALSGRPWVATQHGRPESERGVAALRAALYRGIDRTAQRLSARRVIAVSAEVEAWVGARIGVARTTRVANGIGDPAAGLAVPPYETRPRRVGALGRLAPVKAYELAIDAVAACEGLELEIVGEGPERAGLERRIAASGAGGRIRLLGALPDPRERLASWRALLVTSHHEGSPIGVMEALGLGTPVLSAPLVGVAEILEGQGGWLEEGRDPARWAERLEQILGDEAAGSTASAAARRRYLAAFSAERAAARTLDVYRAALGSSPAELGRGR